MVFEKSSLYFLQIEDYEPCFSIVITPEKMLKYYDDVKLLNEVYPWPGMFLPRTLTLSRSLTSYTSDL